MPGATGKDTEQMKENAEVCLTEKKIWKELAGKRIIMAGLDGEQKNMFAENLAHICSQNGVELTVSRQFEERKPEDLVLLFGQMSSIQETDVQGGFRCLERLMEQLKELTKQPSSSAVLVSDCGVYGKQYGTAKKQKENELGYISHTKKEEQHLHYLRMAEHLACRLAKEENLPIKVVRQDKTVEAKDLERMLESALTVLLYGENGEIYNLLTGEGEEQEMHSPLSPMRIVTDTEKISGLMGQA